MSHGKLVTLLLMIIIFSNGIWFWNIVIKVPGVIGVLTILTLIATGAISIGLILESVLKYIGKNW